MSPVIDLVTITKCICNTKGQKKKKKKKKERKEKRTELLSYWRLGLLEAMDYFENQHIKMNFLPAIMGKDDRFKNVIFLKYIHTGVDPCSI